MKRAKDRGMLSLLRFTLGNAWRIDKGYLFGSVASALIEGILPFIALYAVRMLVSAAVSGGELSGAIVLLCVFFGLQWLLMAVRVHIQWNVSMGYGRMMHRFEAENSRKRMQVDYGCLEDPGAMDIFENLWMTNQITSQVMGQLRSLLAGLIGLLGCAAALFTLSPWVCLLLLCLVLATSIRQGRMVLAVDAVELEGAPARRKWKYFKDITRALAQGKELRTFRAEGFFTDRMDEAAGVVDGFQTRKEGLLLRSNLLVTVANVLQTGFLYAYMTYAYARDAIAIGDFSMYIGVAANVTVCMGKITTALSSIAAKKELLAWYERFEALPETLRLREAPFADMAGGGMAIEFRNVSFRYPGAKEDTLHGVNLSIRPGEVLSIIGENGAGKSTFVKLLTRLYSPSAGSILIDGVDISHYAYEDVMHAIAPVFQDFKLFAYSLRENLTIVPDDSLEDMALASDAAWTALDKAGMAERVRAIPEGLDAHIFKGHGWEAVDFSGGEMQKLASARAFFRDARMAVLDEPTAAMDPLAEQRLYAQFHRWTQGKTAVYISHRMSSARFSDRILFFEGGRIVEEGTHEQLMEKDGLYARMYRTQAHYYQ